MAKLTPTPEQYEIYKCRAGFFLVTANAGSGKTSACAELFIVLYLLEQNKLFPGRVNVGGAEQLQLLRLFWLLSFTKKAAEELDNRIRERFEEEGIPIPIRNSKPVRICRTLDSVLTEWLRNPAFFEEWARIMPAFPSSMQRFHNMLPSAVRNELAAGSVPPTLAFFRKWQSTISEDKQLVLVDAAMCLSTGQAPIGGFSASEIEAATTQYIPTVPTVAALEDYAPVITKMEDSLKEKRTYYTRLEQNLNRTISSDAACDLKLWNARVDRLHSFLTIFDYARSRGWSPHNPMQGIERRDILDAIAGTNGAFTIKDFVEVAVGYQRLKCRIGMKDFGDNLEIFVGVIDKAAHLLERQREYPVRGIRRKYVIQDENQDYNRPQFQIQKALCAAKGVSYLSLGVGDPFQSLYEFRGADPMLFIRGIEKLRESRPENLLTLSCCFRSGRRIVELGNEILRILSRHGDISTPSRAAKNFDGEISVPLPFNDNVTESNYILEKAMPLAAAGKKVMILLRSNTHGHPVAKAVANAGVPNISVMTVHSSKGLEADYVFLCGFNAGVFPDVRCSYEQEKNAFYVACTRARTSLTITCHLTTVTVDKDGSIAETAAYPSPFLKLVPTLEKLALAAGWQGAVLSSGLAAHKQAIAVQIEKRETQLTALRNEIAEMRKNVGAGMPEVQIEAPEESIVYRGARNSDFEIKSVVHDTPASGPTEEPQTDVFEDCKRVFMRGGRPSHLTVEQRNAALRKGWLTYRGQSNQVFSPAFIALLRTAS